MDAIQLTQHQEYSFPYHHLPQVTPGGYLAARRMRWALSYVGALERVASRLAALGTSAHLDIGCGDGALLAHLRRRLPGAVLAGIDYDAQAVAFARLFNPGMRIETGDLSTVDWRHRFTSATLIEVIEHVPPEQLPAFLDGVRRVLTPDARLLVTVPHRNKPLNPKHYRHFSFAELREAVGGAFEVIELYGFEPLSPARRTIDRLLDNRYFSLEIPVLNAWRLRRELAFRSFDERACGRIFAELKPIWV